jgi:2-dehydropantoate 2-reductase
LEGPYDLIILAAKQYDLDAAIAAIGPAVGPQTTILPLLNGLVHLDRLDGTFGPVNVLGGVAYIGASLTADGGIRHHNRLSGIAFGERGGGRSDRVRAIAAEFSGTPVSARGEDNVLLDMWEKFVMITAMAGMNCLMRGNIGEIAATEDGADLMREFVGECGAIAAAAGFGPRPEYLRRIVPMLTAKGSVDSASMRTDLDAVRRTESDAILGDMLDRARCLGVTTPLLRASRCHMQVYENRLSK